MPVDFVGSQMVFDNGVGWQLSTLHLLIGRFDRTGLELRGSTAFEVKAVDRALGERQASRISNVS